MKPAPQPDKRTLTPEQQAIIATNDNLTINAVAGSGKTTTIIEYAASRPAHSRILYIAFNRSVKLEAIRKFADKGLTNVQIETAHSLAYRHILRKSPYRVKQNGYKIHELATLLELSADGTRHAEFVLANHISKFITYFCNSDKAKVQDLNYLDTIHDSTAKKFVNTFYSAIETGTRQLLARMDRGEIEITHDFYLKKFQLSKPELPYDYILFDEGQDASGAMLDVFLRQDAVKVIVGDTHQQIYGWRHAVNSLAKTTFHTLNLSTSFRFPQAIADLASAVLDWKHHIGTHQHIAVTGSGTTRATKSVATIARTNLGLLLSAITFITNHRKVKHIYFEGNIHSYTYADEGASLYDVLYLYLDKKQHIRDTLIQSMKDMDDLEEYVKSTEDMQLGMMIEIVNEYGEEIPTILNKLKSMHTGDDEREKAAMIFSTVHRAKGMEYDIVHLVNDFMSESKLERTLTEAKKDKVKPDIARLNEEINLLYVAITRTRHRLLLPSSLVPEDFPSSPFIERITPIIPAESAIAKPANGTKRPTIARTTKQFGRNEISRPSSKKTGKHTGALAPWTKEMDRELVNLYESDNPIRAIADHFGKTSGAVMLRLKRLGYV